MSSLTQFFSCDGDGGTYGLGGSLDYTMSDNKVPNMPYEKASGDLPSNGVLVTMSYKDVKFNRAFDGVSQITCVGFETVVGPYMSCTSKQLQMNLTIMDNEAYNQTLTTNGGVLAWPNTSTLSFLTTLDGLYYDLNPTAADNSANNPGSSLQRATLDCGSNSQFRNITNFTFGAPGSYATNSATRIVLLDFSFCALTQTSVNYLLQRVSDAYYYNGNTSIQTSTSRGGSMTIRLNGGSNAAPSDTATLNRLTGMGWNIFTN